MQPAQSWVKVRTCGSCDSEQARVVQRVADMDVLRCSNCGALRASKVLSAESVYVKGYHRGEGDLHPFDYTAPLSLEHERLNNDRRLDHLMKHLTEGRLLDVGGGIGTLTAQAIGRGFDATNLEPIGEAVDYALSHSIPTLKGTLEDIDPGVPLYDAVTMMHVLEHLPESRKTLEFVRRLLKPGGLVMVEVPHYGSMSRRASKQGWLGWWPGQHIHYFTKASLSDLFRRSGLEVLRMGTMVLAFDGLILSHYAYIVGLGPLLHKTLAVRGRRRRRSPVSVGDSPGMPPSIRDEPLKRRLLLPPLRALAKLEELSGVGETLWAIGREKID